MKRFMYTAAVILGMALYVFSQENYSTWGYYRTIILNTKTSGASVDSLVKKFPVLVRLNATNAPDVFTQSSANGNDIRFAGMNGSHLNYQKVLWDTTNKKAYFWVLADSVAASDSLAAFKMYWAKSGAADSSKASMVFDTTVANGGGYQAVFHMSNGLTDNDTDATMNKFIAIPTGTSVDSAAGMTGHSRQFDGTGTYFTVQNSATSKLSILDSADFTLSAWAFSDTAPIGTGSRETMIAKFGITTGTTGMGEYKMGITQGVTPFTTAKWEVGAWYNSSASGKRNVYCASPAAVPVAHAWHHVAGTQNHGNFALYIDGVLSSTTYASGSGTKSVTYDVTIGATAGLTSQFFKGKLQELRIENVARGAKYLKLAYQNQFVPTGAASDSLVILGASQTLVAAPVAPTLSAPVNSAPNIGVLPVLTWGTVIGAATYRVQVAAVSDFSTITADDSTLTVGTKTLVSALSGNATYYWRVNAKNIGGTSAWSTLFSFTTVPAAPGTPTLLAPLNAGLNVVLAPTLTWGTVPGATGYHVQLSTSSAFGSTIVDDSLLTAGTKAVTGLVNSTTYYWRALSKNVGGASGWSAPFSFTTIPAAPTAPTLTTPATGASFTSGTVTLTWGTITGAATYRVQVSTVSTFATTVINDSSLTVGTKALTGLTGNTYYWRTSATNAGGTGAWSATFTFTVTITGIASSMAHYSPAGMGHNGVLEVYLANGSRVMELAYSATATKAQLLKSASLSLAKGYYTYRFRSADAKINVTGKLVK